MKFYKYLSIAIIAFLLGTFTATVAAKDEPNGHPFQAIWEAITELQEQIDAILSDNDDINIPCMRVDGNDIYFEGCNIHILSGTGSTDGETNGLGNLIIGYNEDTIGLPNNRMGSHNLIIGSEHTYTSFGGIVAGKQNIINASYASVIAGQENQANGISSVVCGGWRNNATGLNSSILAGRYNSTTGVYSSVVGGEGNSVIGNSSTIGGGLANKTIADYSTVSGGHNNLSTGGSASVCGGENNEARGGSSSVSGGKDRMAIGIYDWIAGSLFEDD